MSHDLYAAKDMPDRGFFQANITSRRTSRPIAGAKIQIRNINDANDIIEETETNSAGKSDLITLPAPPLEYSMMPWVLIAHILTVFDPNNCSKF